MTPKRKRRIPERLDDLTKTNAQHWLHERNKAVEESNQLQTQNAKLTSTQTRLLKIIDKLTADNRELAQIANVQRNVMGMQAGVVGSLIALIDHPKPALASTPEPVSD